MVQTSAQWRIFHHVLSVGPFASLPTGDKAERCRDMLLRPFWIGVVSLMADSANPTTAAFPAKEAGLRPSYLSADWICGVCLLVLCPSDRTRWTMHHVLSVGPLSVLPPCISPVLSQTTSMVFQSASFSDNPSCIESSSRDLLLTSLQRRLGLLLSHFPKVSFPFASFEIAWDFRVVRTISHTYSTLLFLLFAVVERVLSLDVQYRP